MEPVDNNIFEVKPNSKTKRKRIIPQSNVFSNPALDLLANEDPMCNNAMEITSNKRRKRTRSCEIVAFENSALDLGISRSAVNDFLIRELDNVRKNVRAYASPVKLSSSCTSVPNTNINEPLYANLTEVSNIHHNQANALTPDISSEDSTTDIQNSLEHTGLNNINELDSGISILEQKSLNTAITTDLDTDLSAINNISNIQSNVTNEIFISNTSSLNLSFIDRLALESPCVSNQSLYLDDDLNESNIMEIKTITIVTKKKRIPQKISTNPFLNSNLEPRVVVSENPFTSVDESKTELEYNMEAISRPITNQVAPVKHLLPRILFAGDTNSTISTVNESSINIDNHDYENIDNYRCESPIYENIDDDVTNDGSGSFNKQSKILGHDVSRFSAVDIMNLNKNSEVNFSSDSNYSKKDLKHLLKASNKLSKKVLKTLKKTFKGEKVEHNTTLNPYEVPRKPPKQKTAVKESGIENPALKLDNSDEIEIQEIDDDENQYETIKTLRNTRLNMNVTPLKEKTNDTIDLSSTKIVTPGKKVRFDSTLNREKIITGDSFDCGIQSPGFDAKIDTYHDELENCINEKKFIQQNM
ncbi:unnamed protein product [Parnassius apollo]|uniref:(apollo) hypothetical protein n=1 Tax=Parnassius apollo TaxID=110799 RepID=A0A8S3Y2N9_PARAO|nr:unnamed protein product [Parnassius apollo]